MLPAGDPSPPVEVRLRVPYPRQFGPGASGLDCRAVKRALADWAHGTHGMSLKTDGFGKAAQLVLSSFKGAHGLLSDPIYTLPAHTVLEPYFDALGVHLMTFEATMLEEQRLRNLFLQIADLTVVHKGLFLYSELIGEDPGERDWFRVAPLRWDGSVRFSCDCSGHAIGCGAHAGLAHPIFGPQQPLFDSDGATGAILSALPHITANQAQPGDWVVFVGPTKPAGAHVTILRSKLKNGDWSCVNMGGRMDPSDSTLSWQAAYQRAHGAPDLVYVRLPV